MAGQHVVQIPPMDPVHAECEIVHEAKSVVWWPDAVQEVKQCVQSHDRIAYITLR